MSFKRGLLYLGLGLGVIISVIPFLSMIFTSLKPPAEIFGGSWLPKNPTFDNYFRLLSLSNFPLYYFNSTMVALATVTLGLFFDSLAGFAFAKYRFPGRNLLFGVVLLTLMIPSQITLIPSYLVLTRLGLVNTLTGVIIGAVVSSFGIFLIRQYMQNVPDDLLDAARLDGGTDFQIYRTVVIPLIRPALGALAIFRFLSSWNSYLWPLIVLQKAEKFTLPVGLAQIQGVYGTPIWAVQMAGSFLATLPVIILFLLLQRYFISGITLGAVKE